MTTATDWHGKRACATDGRPLWDQDAGEVAHRTAAWICDRRCPVKAECAEEADWETRRPHRRGETRFVGLAAGLMWGDKGGPKTVEEWHAVHRDNGALTRTTKPGAETVVNGVPVERACAARDCDKRFTLVGVNRMKKYCSPSCWTSERKHLRREGLAS